MGGLREIGDVAEQAWVVSTHEPPPSRDRYTKPRHGMARSRVGFTRGSGQ